MPASTTCRSRSRTASAKSADHIAGYQGAFARKRALAAEVVRLEIPLTVNAVMHRANIDRIGAMVDARARARRQPRRDRARAILRLGAEEPRRADADRASRSSAPPQTVEELRRRHHGEIVIDAVVPDYYARLPKPCVGGWGRRSLNVTPAGKVLPCHAAESIPGLEFWSVREHSLADIWANSPAFNAFRGTDWMQEPCRSCARREIDFGGCRCQAFALTGDARATDPVCHLSPRHGEVAALAAVQEEAPYDYRPHVRRTVRRAVAALRGRHRLARFFGTFLPFRRASERPMAIACLRLVTFLPLLPLLSVPRLRFSIAPLTSFDALREYLRAMFNLPLVRDAPGPSPR